ncbi:hypothetical protein BJ875DRAFT_453487 [Amylocarpus encephaloides]|uniref:Isopenicillin N synthase-like Fe(2+) 2OG dioxygenase domain-containing protein n=1 Tax=Amylocarpus encephaloides TaxID=45428 RepID=A0A9P8C8M3_9HELO|nr:hypothetical protein BJ875DRAFT_453487 [Amylocarpus encephaloides]
MPVGGANAMHLLANIKAKAVGLLPTKLKRNARNQFPNQSSQQSNLLPPLKPVKLPRIFQDHSYALHDQGWTKVTYHGPHDDLQRASQALFEASRDFFDLPTSRKEDFRTRAGTEEGWNHVQGEKQFITLRSLEKTPPGLKDAAEAYWTVAGSYLDELLKRISESLGLPAEALGVYSEPCRRLGGKKTATLLRLFRYESTETNEIKTVAEPHRDLGLLSLVVGDTPGLECWERYAKLWFPIEKTFESPAASVMVGRQLERLSNMRYRSGGHLVRSYPEETARSSSSDPSGPPRYRYSIVFVLRAHSPVPVNTDELTTSITGPFQTPLNGMTAGELFQEIHSAHFNINTNVEERNKQRENLASKRSKTKAAEAAHDHPRCPSLEISLRNLA